MHEPWEGRSKSVSEGHAERTNDDPFLRYAARFDRPIGDVRNMLRSSGAEPTAIARALGLPAAAVQGPASFFSDFSAQRGARHVRVCTAAACYAATAGAHVAEVEAALGVETGRRTADGSVSIQAVRCLGYCFAGPAALDGDQACAGADLAAQLRGESAPKAPPIPVHNDSPFPVVTAGLLGTAKPWSVWPGVVASAAPGDILVQVASARLRGRGGAGFSSAAKWRAALEHPGPRVVVANGDEGDPGSYADRLLMEQDPHRVLEGLALACFAVRATTGIVFVRSEYPRAAARLREALLEAHTAGFLGQEAGGEGFSLEIQRGGGCRVVCLRRGNGTAEWARGAARRCAAPSAISHRKRAARPAHRGQQRGNAQRTPMDRAARGRGLRPRWGTADESRHRARLPVRTLPPARGLRGGDRHTATTDRGESRRRTSRRGNPAIPPNRRTAGRLRRAR